MTRRLPEHRDEDLRRVWVWTLALVVPLSSIIGLAAMPQIWIDPLAVWGTNGWADLAFAVGTVAAAWTALRIGSGSKGRPLQPARTGRAFGLGLLLHIGTYALSAALLYGAIHADERPLKFCIFTCPMDSAPPPAPEPFWGLRAHWGAMLPALIFGFPGILVASAVPPLVLAHLARKYRSVAPPPHAEAALNPTPK